MGFINSPNMNLPIPGVGTEPGPEYAQDVNNALTLLDSHDHTPGYGVQITPEGMNINTDLTFNGNFAIDLAGVNLSPQLSTPDVSTIYQSGVDLFFVDALGNDIRITDNGAVAGTPGSIANLVAPASASYVAGSSTFVWESDVGIAANMDFGAAIMRNLSPNSTFALTLQPPAGLSSNFTITLPNLPVADSFVTLTTGGVLAGSIPISLGITNGMIANGTIAANKLAFSVLTNVTSQAFTTSGAFIVPAGVTQLTIRGVGGGAGGGGGGGAIGAGGTGGSGGGGGGGAVVLADLVQIVTPGDTLTITIGAGGTAGTAGAGSNLGSGGQGGNGGNTTVTGTGVSLTFLGGAGGGGGANGTSVDGQDGIAGYSGAGGESINGAGGGGGGSLGAGGDGAGNAGDTGGSGLAGGGGGGGSGGVAAVSTNNGGAGGGNMPYATTGGAAGSGATFANGGGGGGGGGSSLGVGGAGGTGTATPTVGASAAANSGAGGGGGGGKRAVGLATGAAGGAGGSGYVTLSWTQST